MNEKELTIEYLKFERIHFKEETCKKTIMKICKGKINPETAWLISITNNNSINYFYNFYDVIDYVERSGLRKI